MKRKLLLSISVLAAACSLASVSAFAEECAPSAGKKTVMMQAQMQWEGLEQSEILELFQQVLDEEVASGIITQKEADQKYASMENSKHPPQMENKAGRQSITAEEANVEYTAANNREMPKNGGPDGRDEGDQSGTLDKTKMTEEERLSEYKARLDSEVVSGAITQDEADERYAAMENGDINVPVGYRQEILSKEEKETLYKKILQKLVSNETLTQEEMNQKLAILADSPTK